MHGSSGPSRRSGPALWRLAAAWSVVVALVLVATAPLWHDHTHGHAVAADHAHADGSCWSHEHDEPLPASTPTLDCSLASGEHDSCAICLATNLPTGDGLPSRPLLGAPVVAELLRRLGAERPSLEWAGRDRVSRGPPLALPIG